MRSWSVTTVFIDSQRALTARVNRPVGCDISGGVNYQSEVGKLVTDTIVVE
jgi:hypothetical protein